MDLVAHGFLRLHWKPSRCGKTVVKRASGEKPRAHRSLVPIQLRSLVTGKQHSEMHCPAQGIPRTSAFYVYSTVLLAFKDTATALIHDYMYIPAPLEGFGDFLRTQKKVTTPELGGGVWSAWVQANPPSCWTPSCCRTSCDGLVHWVRSSLKHFGEFHKHKTKDGPPQNDHCEKILVQMKDRPK